jgi:DNA-binding SARP family transcriptional activator
MEFRLLGPLEVDDRGRSLPIGGAKQRALLALLLLDAGRVVPAERLIDELWGERPPESAPNILQGYVSHLRDALEPGRARGESRILLTRGGGYVLEADADDIDVRRAERLREQARASTNPEEALRLLDEALALWRGPPLADLAYEPFAQPEVRRLDELGSR